MVPSPDETHVAKEMEMTDSSRRNFIKSSLITAAGAALSSAMPQTLAAQPVSSSPSPLRFGVNYIPRKNWFFSWQDWDAQSVAEDLLAVRDLGMDHIRAHCIWPFFQPGISYVSERLLENLNSLLESADRAGLDVELTVLTGWMSGISFMPGWTAPNARADRNIFTNPEILEAEKLLFTRMAQTIGAHKRFLGFDLGNELAVLLSRGNPATVEQMDAWTTEMFRHVNTIAPGKFHVNGVDHEVWWSDIAFSRQNCGTQGAASIVHLYAFFNNSLKRFGYTGVGTMHLLEYNVELAYAYHTDLSRRVWVEETGASLEGRPESYMADYARQVLENAADTGVLWGVSWWCSHDIDTSIKGLHGPREYTLGLIDQENQVKPMGRILSKLAEELRGKTFSSTQRRTALVIPDAGLSTDPNPPDWTYATPFINLLQGGKKPCIVLESRSTDEGYLRSRGVTELISIADAAKV
jgi:endo-1,4-beta-mannosidase